MDGDWNTVKSKPKKKKVQDDVVKKTFGGKGTGGKLVCGPVKNAAQMANQGKGGDFGALNTQATNIADYDFGGDDVYEEEEKFEMVSHKCAQSVGEARMKANLTQNQLAQKIGEKNSTVVDIENATGRYNAEVINAIEKTLNVKIDRGRKKNRGRR